MSEEKFVMSEPMDPKQWGSLEDWQKVEMPSPEIAKETAKRWDAYNGLMQKNKELLSELRRLNSIISSLLSGEIDIEDFQSAYEND